MAALWKAEEGEDRDRWGRWLPGVVREGLSEDLACDQRIEGSQTVRMSGDVPRWKVPGRSHSEPRKGGHALPCSPIRGRQVGQKGLRDGGEGRGAVVWGCAGGEADGGRLRKPQ